MIISLVVYWLLGDAFWDCKMKKIICFCLLLLNGLPIWAQVQQPQRIEVDLGSDDKYFEVINAGSRGLVFYREVRNRDTKMERKYEVYFLDTMLHVVWKEYYYVHLRYYNIGFDYYGDYFYLLFQQNTNNIKADLYVVRINLKDQRFETFLIEREFPMRIVEFEVIENTLIFGGYSTEKPTVICYTFGISKPKVLPGIYQEKNKLLQIEIDSVHHRFNVLTSFQTEDKRKSIAIKSFDPRGNLLINVNLAPSGERSLLYGRSVDIKEDFILLVGTYARKRSEMSRGIYLSAISANGEHIIYYYSYTDLKNFFSYLKFKKRRRVEERIQRRKIKGRKIRYSYRLIVHDVVKYGDQYVMVGEAFYPKYGHSSLYGSFSPAVYAPMNDIAYFIGYQYTHAIVIGFDKKGKLLWDNSFEIKDVVTFDLKQYVHVARSGDSFVLLYLYDNEIRSKVVHGSDIIEGKSYDDLDMSFKDKYAEINSDSEYGGLENWYGNILYAYGVERVRNARVPGMKPQRDIFFINKIVYK